MLYYSFKKLDEYLASNAQTLLFRYSSSTLRHCILILLLVSNWSCQSKSRKYVLPEDKIVEVVVDLHMMDALIGNKQYEYTFMEPGDSTNLYTTIFEKHGIDQARLDSSLAYYATKGNTLELIYEKVIEQLSKREESIRKEYEYERNSQRVVWSGRYNFKAPRDGAREKIQINARVSDTGLYVISAKIRVDTFDMSVSPSITAYFFGVDSTGKEITYPFDTIPLIKDGQFHTYYSRLRNSDTLITHIKGNILDHEERDGLWEKHAFVRYSRAWLFIDTIPIPGESVPN